MNALTLVSLLLQAVPLHAKVYEKNILVWDVSPDAQITGNEIRYNDPDCRAGMRCTSIEVCDAPGTVPTLSDDKKRFACCLEGQHLLGSPETAFDCCADGHDLAGSPQAGYHCCPTGYTYDGRLCKPVPTCKNGKVLVNGQCVCPEGTVEAADGTCQTRQPTGHCESGLETGKCYTFTAENGNRLGLRNDGVYYAAPDSMVQRYGKFQLCRDEKCTPGQPINPSDKTYIKDLYGDVATGANTGQWLNNAQNGAHIGRTPTFANAGQFVLSKWPCGKYCLGGFTAGVGPACPAEIPAMTFYSQDPQMCTPFDLTEVPCDIRADSNNCIWKNGDQCCNKVDCTWKH
ncbi:hypothetical protein C8A03DRAFT_13276 [Achaetomium macrosporum]|uniref:Cysteine-rich secreted protein n=1 Tax=Achaetomium macrosporum TaxID=79813 RepID=A0AAN7HD14_9PEZI|nr:hypothetical protein C8A03DRAFT_13276 [Achaetomium macrosporum]